MRLRSVDVGFDTRDIVAATTVLPAKRYPAARAMQFYDEATDTLAATPGVEAVATADIEPLTTAILEAPVRAAGRPDDRADTLRVSRAYFDVLHIARLKGRLFDRNDERDGAAVAVVSESMARRFWGDADPVGQRIVVWKNVTAQIVGVVADVRCGLRNPRTGARQPARPTVYVPYDAAYRRTGARTFLVRVSPSAGNVGPALRAQLAALDPDLFVSPVPLDQLREDALVTPSFYTLVLTVFASVGLVLAGIGIAGVSAQNVVRRRHEIGVRLALGATASQVVAQVTRETIGPAVIGLVLGLAAAGALTRSLAALLFEVEARDPATFAAVAVLLVGVAVAASYVSARRAAKLDPIAVLRAN